MFLYPQDTSRNTFLFSQWDSTYSDGKAKGRMSLSIQNRNLMFFIVDSEGNYHGVGASDCLNLRAWNVVAVTYLKGEMTIYTNGETRVRKTLSNKGLLKGEWPLYFLTANDSLKNDKYNIVGINGQNYT
jgi:hypothetical protein